MREGERERERERQEEYDYNNHQLLPSTTSQSSIATHGLDVAGAALEFAIEALDDVKHALDVCH